MNDDRFLEIFMEEVLIPCHIDFEGDYTDSCRAVRDEIYGLRALLSRININALRAFDNGAPLPDTGWYEDTESGQRSRVFYE
jgi:hypothetical protein